MAHRNAPGSGPRYAHPMVAHAGRMDASWRRIRSLAEAKEPLTVEDVRFLEGLGIRPPGRLFRPPGVPRRSPRLWNWCTAALALALWLVLLLCGVVAVSLDPGPTGAEPEARASRPMR